MVVARAEAPVRTEPDPALFWSWMAKAIRPRLGWILTGLGALAIVIGYLGVSTRVLVAEQLPYVISGGIGGIALVIVGGVFLATDDTHNSVERLDELAAEVRQLHAMVADLHGALLRPLQETSRSPRPAPAGRSASANGNGTGASSNGNGSGSARTAARAAERVYALPSGSTFHRSGCSVLEGKSTATAVTADTIGERGLTPCSLCTPAAAHS
jgi:hypothetical protein